MDTAVFIAVLALFGTVVAGLFKLIDKLTNSLDAVASTNKDIAEATAKGAREAKARNGHLAEITELARDAVLNAVHGLTIEKQTVNHQHVLEETVDSQTIKE